MPGLYNTQLDDAVLMDISVPISGVNNTLPPSALDASMASDALNRLSQLDALNRPRPGIIRKKHTPSSLNSIHHLGVGQFLANDGATWYKYDHRSNVLNTVSGGPAFTSTDQVYSALADQVLYFSRGDNLYKYTPATSTFAAVVLPSPYLTAKYPLWACNRLMYCYQNNLIVSDILDPETFDVITSSLTIDPIASDTLTGLGLWQGQNIVLFRNGSTWITATGPGLAVTDWTLNKVSGKVGCRCHGTIQQCGADIYFLSETGRGVYALSQAPASEQQGVWVALSADIQGYINRINWAACDCARATFWNDLYLLSVPLDQSTYNNYVLVYSVSLQKWQGLWCIENGTQDLGFRDAAIDRTDPNASALLYATMDGVINEQTYPPTKQFYDLNEDLTQQPFEGLVLTKAFTFGGLINQSYASGEMINRIRPHSARIQFLDSADPVEVQVIGDRTVELDRRNVATNTYELSLPIPAFPFDLDPDGFAIIVIGLMKTGIWHELQLQISGDGNWTMYKITVAAFEAYPLIPT